MVVLEAGVVVVMAEAGDMVGVAVADMEEGEGAGGWLSFTFINLYLYW